MVFWINNPFDPLPGEGGRPLRYWLLSRALVAAGHQVVWWSSDFHHLRKRRRVVPAVYQAEGFQVRLIATSPYVSNVGLQRLRSHRRYAVSWGKEAVDAVNVRELPPPDCIVVSMPPLGLYDAAARMRERWGCRVVVDVQDAWPETFYQLLPRRLGFLGKGLFVGMRRQAARAYRVADAISAVSERYAELVRTNGCRVEPQVFRLGCCLPPRCNREGAGGPLRLCYLGNLGVSYDIRTMVCGVRDLAAAGQPVTLDVAGDGPLKEWVAATADQAASPVRYHGYLDDTALRACLSGCDLGVIPMWDASWVAVPNKVVDYAAAGLAVINGLSGETRELLQQYDAGVRYEPGDVASFKQAVSRYLQDRELLGKHQAGARRLAEAVFDAEIIYPKMARWLEG